MEKRLSVAMAGVALATAVVGFGTAFVQSPWSDRWAAVEAGPAEKDGERGISEAALDRVEVHDVGAGDTIPTCKDISHEVVAVQGALDLVILRRTDSGEEVEVGRDTIPAGGGCTLRVERLHTPLHANAPRARLILTGR